MAGTLSAVQEAERDIENAISSTSANGLAEVLDDPDTRRKFTERMPRANDADDGW